jgi:hypothetical protein
VGAQAARTRLARWQRYPAAVALAAGDAIKFKLDAYGGRQLHLDALAQSAQAQLGLFR